MNLFVYKNILFLYYISSNAYIFCLNGSIIQAKGKTTIDFASLDTHGE